MQVYGDTLTPLKYLVTQYFDNDNHCPVEALYVMWDNRSRSVSISSGGGGGGDVNGSSRSTDVGWGRTVVLLNSEDDIDKTVDLCHTLVSHDQR